MEGGVLSQYIIAIPALGFLVAQILKTVIRYFDPRFDNAYIMSSGGMPSVHSAFVTSLTTAVALKEGLGSTLFAITVCFAAIVLYDAMNIRYEGGKHAAAINHMAKNFEDTKELHLNEHLGHKQSEVLVGGILGILLALVLYFI